MNNIKSLLKPNVRFAMLLTILLALLLIAIIILELAMPALGTDANEHARDPRGGRDVHGAIAYTGHLNGLRGDGQR